MDDHLVSELFAGYEMLVPVLRTKAECDEMTSMLERHRSLAEMVMKAVTDRRYAIDRAEQTK